MNKYTDMIIMIIIIKSNFLPFKTIDTLHSLSEFWCFQQSDIFNNLPSSFVPK